jgi:virulence-associated protein VagC
MTTTQIFESGDGQLVRLPTGFEFSAREVAIRREGQAIILEPIKPVTWPEGFFERIRITDPAFRRPDQGSTPDVPSIDLL